jgi:hypothetical protein
MDVYGLLMFLGPFCVSLHDLHLHQVPSWAHFGEGLPVFDGIYIQ